jgi:tRNA (cmo5U34)-methyltransferase
VAVRDASVVVLNFTLQFLPPADRLALLSRIHRGLRSGGILILSEKIAGEDAPADALLTDMHHAFKRANGYSELEISRKRTALEKVLLPETLDTHRARLQQAGFSRSDLWFQCFNFVSLVAFR